MKFLMIKLQAPGGILLRAMAGTYLPATGGTHLSATGGTPRASRAARHVSLNATGQYNGWNFGSAEKGNPFQDRVRGGALGMRYWTWNVFSGWWFGFSARCEEYNRGGLFGRMETEEGFAFGGGLSIGYSHMLSRHWNLDFGIGGWCGGKGYTLYACPRCGTIIDKGRKFFAMPSADTQVSIVYIF